MPNINAIAYFKLYIKRSIHRLPALKRLIAIQMENVVTESHVRCDALEDNNLKTSSEICTRSASLPSLARAKRTVPFVNTKSHRFTVERACRTSNKRTQNSFFFFFSFFHRSYRFKGSVGIWDRNTVARTDFLRRRMQKRACYVHRIRDRGMQRCLLKCGHSAVSYVKQSLLLPDRRVWSLSFWVSTWDKRLPRSFHV